MRTIDYEGTVLNIVPSPSSACMFAIGTAPVSCHLRGSNDCDRYCPDGNRTLPSDVQSHILLDDACFTQYLTAKLMRGMK